MNLDAGYYGSPRWSWEILDCAMPMTFDTYSNCAHQCLYCFAYFQRAVGDSADDYLHHRVRAINIERVKRMFTDPEEHGGQFGWYIKRRLAMQWGGLSDGFDWYERKFRKSLELLRFFREIEYPISISTKAVWWLDDPEYTDLLRGAKHIQVKISIITLDQGHAQVLEAGAPTPAERMAGLAKVARLGPMATLRFRPYIIGRSDLCDEELLRQAKDAGCASATTEFLCLESRSKNLAAERFQRMSAVLAYDIFRFYKLNSSARTGLLRLNYELKRPYIRRMEAVCREVGLPFYVSDSHHKEASCGGNCCGMPETGPLGHWQRGQFTQAVQLAKANGQVTWTEVEALAGDLATVPYYRATYFNAGSTENRAKRRYQTMVDFMHETWNDVHGVLSPARYFGGVLVAGGPDVRGDIVYFYNRPWVDDGRRIDLGSDLQAESA